MFCGWRQLQVVWLKVVDRQHRFSIHKLFLDDLQVSVSWITSVSFELTDSAIKTCNVWRRVIIRHKGLEINDFRSLKSVFKTFQVLLMTHVVGLPEFFEQVTNFLTLSRLLNSVTESSVKLSDFRNFIVRLVAQERSIEPIRTHQVVKRMLTTCIKIGLTCEHLKTFRNFVNSNVDLLSCFSWLEVLAFILKLEHLRKSSRNLSFVLLEVMLRVVFRLGFKCFILHLLKKVGFGTKQLHFLSSYQTRQAQFIDAVDNLTSWLIII